MALAIDTSEETPADPKMPANVQDQPSVVYNQPSVALAKAKPVKFTIR